MIDVLMFAGMCISVTIAYLIVFGGLGCLIRKFAHGKTQRILYIILAVLAIYETIFFCIFLKDNGGFGSIVALMVSSFLFITNKFPKKIKLSNMDWTAPRSISVLKGYHIYGLSANEGIVVSAVLYDDKIVFKSGNHEIGTIDAEDIISVSSSSEQEVVGAKTTGSQKTGIASTVALMSGDYAAAYFLRPKTTTYKTKNIVKKYWYFVLDTATNTVILQAKSYSSLYYFVDLCNRMLERIEYEEETEDDDIDSVWNILISAQHMSGEEFEQFCAKLLRANGYADVSITSHSGDQGLDILAEKDGLNWGFQCKRWNPENHVGNDAVQKTFAGKAFYHCDIAVVITTSTFTHKAREYANETGVLLWDQDKLYKLIEKAQSK